ncbi:MAG: 7-cyano-7-deazaguanine synthase QueC [Candidatus Eisenbacteria bacterium]|uniref:7-cyano-7-deazaguanine synthase n=1 Tax=Eiseniibacteriota bacterium TaxID=2212470 RepID=A0A956NGQ0_UNCEI|nr:7-cyano-7-deazaguanine synthase QueC [Candidatus Eisenbacteria bacterium]
MGTEGSRKAVALLSGGMDSATTVAIALRDGFEVTALSFSYGQRHSAELAAARAVAKQFGITQHHIVDIDLRAVGGSALTSDLPVPKSRSAEEMSTDVPITYVPARNTVFLSFGLAWAEVLGADDIFIGVNALDYSGYPDCRPEFISAFEHLANLATRTGVEDNGRRIRIRAPLIAMTKAEIVREGMSLGVDYSLTRTCYDPTEDGLSCGRCDACILRLRGFAECGLEDPAPYVPGARPGS